MDVSTLLTVAQTLLQLLDSSIMREIENIWSFKSQLEKIKSTMTTIKAVLLDAEEQERQQVQHNHVDCDWLEKLRFIVYQADNLFDEILTVAHQGNLIMDSSIRASSTTLWLFISRPTFMYKKSLEMKKIREKLDGFAKDRRDFGSSYSRQVVSVVGKVGRRRLESHSFVRDKDVIGRDVDKSRVVDMLLDSRVEDVSFVSIIGIGGLGKTTLAQLVYNDERIKKEFSLKFWICVGEEFDVKVIVAKILGLGRKLMNDDLAMDELQIQLQEKIVGKKYLLVLDDVWNEHRQEWLNLENLLVEGGKGSRILVTTRSRKVAKIIGKNRGYELKGLSEEDSWHLFERIAFEEEKDLIDADLVDIGKEIVRKCANVPLAIKTVGSLLYKEGESTWRSVKNVDLANIEQTQNGIIPILKVSYYHLTSAIKSCLNYCVLFPKGFELEKETLMCLWIAQGYVLPQDSQNVEDIAEEYYITLMHRCFLEAAKVDDHGEILTCKIHDLMHEVVQEVAGVEFLVAKSITSPFSEKMHHISIDDLNLSRCFPTMKGVRTFLHFQHGYICEPFIDHLLSSGKYLRVLDLHHSRIKCLPRKIGYLLHLRYLDISHNLEIEVLPSSITKLYNLQTLKLSHCQRLKMLPSDFSNLVTLRHLDISHCYGLTQMPPKMNSLSCLRRLTMFVLGGLSHSYRTKQVWFDHLENLRSLTELTIDLTIRVQKGLSCKQSASIIRKTRYIMNTQHLKELCIEWVPREPEHSDEDEALLEGLEPHFKLKNFELKGFPGTRFPMWTSWENLGTRLIQLVRISLKNCKLLRYLPPLSRLQHLKTLELCSLENLEYVDNARQDTDCHFSFFPLLEILRLDNLPRLKGWSLSVGFSVSSNEQLLLPSLSRLTELLIWDCPHLAFIPVCPNVEKLNMRRFKDSLLEIIRMKEIMTDDPHSSLQSSSPSINHQELMHELNSLQVKFDEHLSWVKISESRMETLSRFEDVFGRCTLSTLIRSLEISNCLELQNVLGGGLEHLTALERLRLAHLPVLDLNNTEGDQKKSSALWGSLQNLQVLALDSLPKLVKLPNEMQCLTALQSLRISNCRNLSFVPEWIGCLKFLEFLHFDYCQELKSLPEALRNLTSLQRLEIWQCSADMVERCRRPTGEDWPNIRHIPIFSIHTC